LSNSNNISSVNSFGVSERSWRLLLESLAGCPEVERAILFGSRAMGNYRQGSDIDIALVGDHVTLRTIAHLSALLNERLPLPYQVDLVDYSHIGAPALQRHIDEHGVVIWDARNGTESLQS